VLAGAAGLALYAHYVVPRQIALAITVAAWSVVAFLVSRLGIGLYSSLSLIRSNLAISREQLQQQQHLTRKMSAEARLAEREAAVMVVTAPHDQQILIRDEGHVEWRTAHLDPRRYANGLPTDATPIEVLLWHTFHQPRLPSPSGRGVGGEGLMLPAGAAYELPNLVRWRDLLPSGRGDMNNLVLGVHLNAAGRLQPLTTSLYDLFHTIVAASTGWGKSAFVNAVLAQLATCPDPVEFVLIDQQDHGLAPFKTCDRLRYPLLRQPDEILSALHEVHQEATLHRSALFAACDADDLAEYNRRADTFLPPIVVVVEEAASLLANKEIGAQLKKHAWELRKFGVYQFMLLTSAKGTTIDTDHRQQFASKVQLHANEKRQARLLLDAPEAVTFPPGRAVIDLPGSPMTIVQTPYIDKREVRALLRPASAPPAAPPPLPLGEGQGEGFPTDKQRAVLDLWDDGERDEGFIARAVYGEGGRQLGLVRATLEKFNRIT
jgi:DNA segregation ATPase FtsK/SpoIIIE-like protein